MADFTAYTSEVDAQIMDWDGRIKYMENKDVESKVVNDLRDKRDQVRHKLNALQKEGDDWEKVKPELDRMRGEVQDYFEKVSLQVAQ